MAVSMRAARVTCRSVTAGAAAAAAAAAVMTGNVGRVAMAAPVLGRRRMHCAAALSDHDFEPLLQWRGLSSPLKLYYFAMRGKGEQIRLLAHETGTPYEDYLLNEETLKRLSVGDGNDMFFAQPSADAGAGAGALRQGQLSYDSLPVLVDEANNVVLAHTTSILQFIAQRSGNASLLPHSEADHTRALTLCLGAENMFRCFWPLKIEQSRHFSAQAMNRGLTELVACINGGGGGAGEPTGNTFLAPATFVDDALPRWLRYFETLLTKAPSGGYFLGAHLSFADIAVFDALDASETLSAQLVDFPRLHAFRRRVAERPRIARYLASRPEYAL